jgi:5-formyltetrahydrofolate cyclo-ligase
MKKENRRLTHPMQNFNTPLIEKELARSILKKKRSALSPERRQKAYADLNLNLLPVLKKHQKVLSFDSLPDEIDTTWINHVLAKEGKLYLPKVQQDSLLQIYQVHSSNKLVRSPWGVLEPNPSQCAITDIKEIDCILVPGLGFDKEHHRIGYGKGCYDRLLAHCFKRSFSPTIIGIGFKEQFCEHDLPHEAHDIPLDDLKLF